MLINWVFVIEPWLKRMYSESTVHYRCLPSRDFNFLYIKILFHRFEGASNGTLKEGCFLRVQKKTVFFKYLLSLMKFIIINDQLILLISVKDFKCMGKRSTFQKFKNLSDLSATH